MTMRSRVKDMFSFSVAVPVLLILCCVGLQADTMAYANTFGANQFGTLDLTSGVFSPIATEAITLAGLGVNNGNLYTTNYASFGAQLYQVNTTTGGLTPVGASNVADEFVAFGSTQTGLYALDNFDAGRFRLFSVDPTTGVATLVGNTGVAQGGDFTLSDNSGTLYLADLTTLYTLNVTTGLASTVGSFGGSQEMGGLLTEGGTLYGAQDFPGTAHVATINPGTGAASVGPTITGTGSGSISGLAPNPLSTVSSVPEPGGVVLLGSVLVVVLGRVRRR